MKFALVLQQEGDGCDHTIACGTRVDFFEAGSIDGARHLARARMHEEDGHWLMSEHQMIARATLVQVLDDLPLDDWRADLKADRRAQVVAADEAAERRQYEALRRKFGP